MTSKLSTRTSTRSSYDWFTTMTTNILKANARKIKAMFSLQKHNPYPDLRLEAIERVNDVTFLGILISTQLSRNIHIDVICKKARRRLGLIHRNFHLAPKYLLQTLYITLVLLILEYSCATWHPLNKTLTNRLESVQRFV